MQLINTTISFFERKNPKYSKI